MVCQLVGNGMVPRHVLKSSNMFKLSFGNTVTSLLLLFLIIYYYFTTISLLFFYYSIIISYHFPAIFRPGSNPGDLKVVLTLGSKQPPLTICPCPGS